jgi:hypothetical protein
MNNKRITSTMIAAASAFCIAMTGMLPVQAEEAASNQVCPTDKIVTIGVYGDASISEKNENGKTLLQITPGKSGSVTNPVQNNNDQAASLFSDFMKSVTDNIKGIAVGDLNSQGTESSNTQGTQNTDSIASLDRITAATSSALDANGNGTGSTDSVSDITGNSVDQEGLTVIINGTNYNGSTTIALGNNQKVNLNIQDGCAASMEMNAEQIQINEATASTPEFADTTVSLSQEQVTSLCNQLFVVDDDKKCIIINLWWWNDKRDKPGVLNSDLTKLQKYAKVGGYNWYGVNLPINSILSTSEAFTLAEKTREEIETEISERLSNTTATPTNNEMPNRPILQEPSATQDKDIIHSL